jgi:hypothetical protein
MSSSKSTTERKFVLVYQSDNPKALHARTEKECWTGHMRDATPEELKQLQDARCKHCVARLARAAAPPKVKREPISRHEPEGLDNHSPTGTPEQQREGVAA